MARFWVKDAQEYLNEKRFGVVLIIQLRKRMRQEDPAEPPQKGNIDYTYNLLFSSLRFCLVSGVGVVNSPML